LKEGFRTNVFGFRRTERLPAFGRCARNSRKPLDEIDLARTRPLRERWLGWSEFDRPSPYDRIEAGPAAPTSPPEKTSTNKITRSSSDG